MYILCIYIYTYYLTQAQTFPKPQLQLDFSTGHVGVVLQEKPLQNSMAQRRCMSGAFHHRANLSDKGLFVEARAHFRVESGSASCPAN